LRKIAEDLGLIAAKQKEVSDGFSKMSGVVGEETSNNVKKVESFLARLRGLSGRVATQMRGDFTTLASINALQDSLKLSNQFRGTIKDTFTLSDSIRKLGGVFGIAHKDFTKFQTSVVKGLGEMGLSSDVAARTLEGLSTSGTNVRGEGALVGYSQTAGQLGSVTRQQGQEGDIAKLMAQVIQARGGNVSDMKQVADVAEDVRRVFNQTGAGAAQTLEQMKTIFTGMSKDFRQKITSRGLANLSAAGNVAGPGSTKFLEEFMSTGSISRSRFEAQGFKGVVGENGIDIEKFRAASKDILSRIKGDPRRSAQTLGLSEEAAEGFVRLADSLDRVKEAQDAINSSTGDLATQYKTSMGFGEAFRASIERVKKNLAGPLSSLSQGGTDLLGQAAGSDMGSAGVVAGGGILAALLAGAGTRGLGKGLLGTAMRGSAAESITGQKTVPVYVTNVSEMGAGSSGMVDDFLKKTEGFAGGAAATAPTAAPGLIAKAMPYLKGAGMVGLAGAAGYGVGMGVEKVGNSFEGTTEEGMTGGAFERLMFKLDKVLSMGGFGTGGGENAARFERAQKVLVELNTRDLKVSKQPSRGASH
jgi:hypothetical protein